MSKDAKPQRDRRYISVSTKMYAKIKKLAVHQGVSVSQLIERLTADVGGGR